MSETSQRTIEKFVHVACDNFTDDIVIVSFLPWSENSPFRFLQGRALVPKADIGELDEQEMESTMDGKRVIVAGCTFEDSAEEEAARRILAQLGRFQGMCVLIVHLLCSDVDPSPEFDEKLMERHERMLSIGVHDVLMDPDLDDPEELVHAVNMAVSIWQTNSHRMKLMLAHEPEVANEDELRSLQKTHQHLLWDSIPRALMPQLNLPRVLPEESKAGVGQYVFGEKLPTLIGSVTRAFDTTKPNELLAVKILDKSSIFTPGELEGIYRELRFLSEVLRHPNVAHCRDHVHTKDFLYMVFDFAGEHNLAGFLRLQPSLRFAERSQVFHCFREIVAGLAYCHSKDAAHRNLTLEHIVIETKPDDTYHCTIVDFRRAMVVRGSECSIISVGTVPYVAPEAVSGAYQPIFADCWSMGIILLEMVGGLGSTFSVTSTTKATTPKDFKSATERYFIQDGAHSKALQLVNFTCDMDIVSLLSALLMVFPQKRGSMRLVTSMLST